MPNHAQLPLWDDKDQAQKLDALAEMVDDLYGYVLADMRQQLIHTLENAKPYDNAEKTDIAEMLRLIHRHNNIMAQNCEVGHLTGSALILNATSGHVLLHHHKKLKKWLQMGGHADYERDLALVALREAQEESGLPDLHFYPSAQHIEPIDFDIHPIPARKNRPDHVHLDWRYLLATHQPDAVQPPDGESQNYRWLTFDEAISLVEDHALQRLILKAKAIYNQQ